MDTKIIIDPVTRISGFLRIEVQINNNTVTDAKCSGLIYRGFEKMLKGRSPLDAVYFTERICGICSTAHSYVSTIALENALHVVPSKTDNIIRAIIHGCEFLQNHIRHFYLYTLPDYVKIPGPSPLENVEFTDMRIPEKENDYLNEDYLKAVKYSRMAHEAIGILGGKAPHNHGILPGGVTCNLDAIKITKLKYIISEIRDFITFNMIRDVKTIGNYYNDYFYMGKGYGNLMSYGVFDNFEDNSLNYVKPGVMINGTRKVFMPQNITQNIHYSWYEESGNADLSKSEAYSFIKAPRYDGYAMEVGPLSRMILSGDYINRVSCMDRLTARVMEAKKIADLIYILLDKLSPYSSPINNIEMPDEAEGSGFSDTTRGALAHFVSIKKQKIENYSIITPTAWNASSKDDAKNPGVIEKALIGTTVSDLNHPSEIGRIVRSFDPCISCAVHVTGCSIPSLEFNMW